MKRNLLSTVIFMLLISGFIYSQTISFDKDEVGKTPKGFTTSLTGNGKIGNWVIIKDESAPSKPNVLAQTDMDATGYRFPICVYNNFSAKNVEVSVKFKAVKGKEDQAAGIIWRYKDKDNYYIVRANALEENVVLYKVEKGRRIDLPLVGKGKTYGMKTKVPSGVWNELKIVAKDNLFTVFSNGNKLYDVNDQTFTDAGKIGLWTKADSYTLFDDLIIKELK